MNMYQQDLVLIYQLGLICHKYELFQRWINKTVGVEWNTWNHLTVSKQMSLSVLKSYQETIRYIYSIYMYQEDCDIK